MANPNESGCSGSCSDCGVDCAPHPGDVTITLTMDDDTTVQCAILTTFTAGGEQQYIALLPLDENGDNNDGEVYLFHYNLDALGNPSLENIDDDEEYAHAAETFNEMVAELQKKQAAAETE